MSEWKRDNSGERTEAPTSLQWDRAREAGLVARSPELAGALLLAGAAGLLAAVGPAILRGMLAAMRGGLGSAGEALTPADASRGLLDACRPLLLPVLGLLLGLCGIALLAGALQVGLRLRLDRCTPDPSRLMRPPSASSRRMAVRTVAAVAKLALLAAVTCATFRGMLPQFAALPRLSASELPAAAGALLGAVTVRILPVLLLLGLLDYAYQRWEFHQSLRMTPREVAQDLKDLEANPQLRRRRRAAVGVRGTQRVQ